MLYNSGSSFNGLNVILLTSLLHDILFLQTLCGTPGSGMRFSPNKSGESLAGVCWSRAVFGGREAGQSGTRLLGNKQGGAMPQISHSLVE